MERKVGERRGWYTGFYAPNPSGLNGAGKRAREDYEGRSRVLEANSTKGNGL